MLHPYGVHVVLFASFQKDKTGKASEKNSKDHKYGVSSVGRKTGRTRSLQPGKEMMEGNIKMGREEVYRIRSPMGKESRK